LKKGYFKVLTILLTLALIFPLIGAQGLANQGSEQQQELSFIVVFNGEYIPEDFGGFVTNLGGVITDELPEIGTVSVTTSNATHFLKATLARKDVLSIGPSLEMTLNLPQVKALDESELNATESDVKLGRFWDTYQWDMKQVTNDGESYKINSGSKDVVVAVIDTGIDIYHPDLAANIVNYKTFVPGTTADGDGNGHGTHVAGTIGANGSVLGVAPNVGLSAYRVFGDTGGARQEHIIAAIVEAANDGVDVINMSLGGFRVKGQWIYNDPETGERIKLGNDAADVVAYNRAIRYAIKNNVTVVVAAGNDAQDVSKRAQLTKWYQDNLHSRGLTMYELQGATFDVPSGIPGVINVSATVGGFGVEDRLASYSNFGNGAIDITAPGGDAVFEGTPVPYYFHFILSTNAGGGYVFMAGTSMAAPHVAGAAAAYIDHVYQTTGEKPKPNQVKAHLLKTAESMGKKGYDQYYGHGLLNVYNALTQ